VQNNYQPPSARLEELSYADNNSGGGSGVKPPDGVKGWSWGAFLLSWIWSLGNGVWMGLLALVPYVGFLMAIYLGIRGREHAWQSKRWESLEHFNRVQRSWSKWGIVFVVVAALAGILAGIMVPAYHSYVLRRGGA
jgi:uncharacterized membrane protein YeaQ/YmgE (transglycosylase-associated protein family)